MTASFPILFLLPIVNHRINIMTSRVNDEHQDVAGGDNDRSECHILPCTVDYTGPAPVRRYFQPQTLSSRRGRTGDAPVQAAQFRGRGLLAGTAVAVSGQVWELEDCKDDDGRTTERNVTRLAQFSHVTEWQHAHLVEQVQQQQQQKPTSVRSDGNRVQRAREWMELAAALHTPLPVEEDEPV